MERDDGGEAYKVMLDSVLLEDSGEIRVSGGGISNCSGDILYDLKWTLLIFVALHIYVRAVATRCDLRGELEEEIRMNRFESLMTTSEFSES